MIYVLIYACVVQERARTKQANSFASQLLAEPDKADDSAGGGGGGGGRGKGGGGGGGDDFTSPPSQPNYRSVVMKLLTNTEAFTETSKGLKWK